jgi:hypothetical protein
VIEVKRGITFLVVAVLGWNPISGQSMSKPKTSVCRPLVEFKFGGVTISSVRKNRETYGVEYPNGDRSNRINKVHGAVVVRTKRVALGQVLGPVASISGHYGEVIRRVCVVATVVTADGKQQMPIFVWGGSVFVTPKKAGPRVEIRSRAPDVGEGDVCLGGSFEQTSEGERFFVGAPWPNCKQIDDVLFYSPSGGTPVPMTEFLERCPVNPSTERHLNRVGLDTARVCDAGAGLPYLLP